MELLQHLSCDACRSDATAVDDTEARNLLSRLPDWKLERHEGIACLSREYRFRNFAEAFAFAGRIAALAEQQDHHPLMQVEWGKVRLRWWTHRINGLHLNDFIMAAKSDQAADL